MRRQPDGYTRRRDSVTAARSRHHIVVGPSYAVREATSSVLSDVDVIRAIRRGDASAICLLRQRHDAALRRVGLAMLGTEQESAGALEGAYEKAIRSLGKFSSDAAFANWLIGLMIAECEARRGLSDEPYWPCDP